MVSPGTPMMLNCGETGAIWFNWILVLLSSSFGWLTGSSAWFILTIWPLKGWKCFKKKGIKK